MTRRPDSGLALIVVVGVLGVLSVLAVAFVTMAQLERKASLQRVTAAKAYMLARSGIEDAQARLGMGQDPLASCNRYAGEDWNANGLMDFGVETASQVYNAGALDTDACPVRYALRPSFFVRDPTNLPRLQAVDGRPSGYSGALSEDSVPQGNHYVLKVEGTSGFYVNGGDPNHHSYPNDPTATTDYNTMLRRMLGTLADAIDHEDGVGDGKPVAQADGWALIDQRPNTGWQSFNQIRDLALGGNQAKMDALKPYLTLSAWVDKKVIAPNVTATIANTDYHTWGDIKLAHKLNPFIPPGNTSHAPDFERGFSGQIVGRAPVDLAWARKSRPALIALMANLKGLYFDETAATNLGGETGAFTSGGAAVPGTPDTVGTLRPVQIVLDWTQPTDDCRTAVSAILTWTSPLGTWQQFSDFCDTIPFPDFDPNWNSLDGPPPASGVFNATTWYYTRRFEWASDLKQAKKDLLKANFNPNSDLNKFNPNPSLWKLLDKSDLLAYSTEFNLLPGLGGQQVSCAGRVLGASGKLLASRTLTATIGGGASIVRLSTQRDFVNDENGVPRLPGQPTFISPSRGSVPTWGQTLPGLGPVPGQTPGGASLQSYPEPCVNPGGGLQITPADYDGNLQLATVETARDDWYGVDKLLSPPPLNMMMLARFDDTLDLSVWKAAQAPPPPPWLTWSSNQPDAKQVGIGGPGQLGTGVLQEASAGSRVINTLYPDGCYSELDRAPAYLDKGNSDGFHGTMSFWVKANYGNDMHNGGTQAFIRPRMYVRRTRFNNSDIYKYKNQPFYLWDGLNNGGDALTGRDYFLQFSSGKESDGGVIYETPYDQLREGHRWHLLTVGWDFQGLKTVPGGSDTDFGVGEIFVDNGSGTADATTANVGLLDSPSQHNDPTSASDITVDDLISNGPPNNVAGSGPHQLVLGLRMFSTIYDSMASGQGADATFDEFAIYDFGGATVPPKVVPSNSQAAPGILAQNRYGDGRYYSESVYKNDLLHPDNFPGNPLLFPGNTAAQWFSALITLGPGPVTIKSLAWTQVVPRGLKAPLPATASDGGPAQRGWDGDDGPDDGQIVFDLADAGGMNYPKDTGSQFIHTLFTNDASSLVGRTVNTPFRLHAVFLPNLSSNVPLLDPLALDDITLLSQPVSGPGISSWQEGE